MQIPNLLDRNAACEFFGGTRPINAATLYRGIRQGRYPRPLKVGALSFAPLCWSCNFATRPDASNPSLATDSRRDCFGCGADRGGCWPKNICDGR
jgi:hypothetical protein